MQESSVQGAKLTLRIVTPRGIAFETACDSVTLSLMDDAEGNGGGRIGVHRGHVDANMALGEGWIGAMKDGVSLARIVIAGGFALVERDVVTVITDSAETAQDRNPLDE